MTKYLKKGKCLKESKAKKIQEKEKDDEEQLWIHIKKKIFMPPIKKQIIVDPLKIKDLQGNRD